MVSICLLVLKEYEVISLNKPLLLKPSAKDYLWGGKRLNDEFAKNIDLFPLAETWECSTHPDGPSFISDTGDSLSDVIKLHPEYLGTRHKGKDTLPILVKLIDARQDLSVQVHPSDEYAKEHENGQLGKTEMWYVLDSTSDASLVYGLTHTMEKSVVADSVIKGTIEKYLQRVPVKKDDLFFIEAGTIHAIGAGSLIAEIQENSNLTYRLYDYGRVDSKGQTRQLHVEKALEVANLNSMAEPKQPLRVLRYRQGVASELLCRCKYFEVYRMLINTEHRNVVHYQSDSLNFRVLLCTKGCGTLSFEESSDSLKTINIYKGDCVFVPADSVVISLHGQMQFLDIRG